MITLHENVVGDQTGRLLFIFQSAVFLVLLICCANAANLLLVRFSRQQPGLAIRFALGAVPLRVAGQILLQVLLLSAAGSALGLLFSHWGVDFLRNTKLVSLPRQNDVAVDWTVLLFAFGSLLLVTAFTSVPMLIKTARLRITESLQSSPVRASGDRRLRLALRSLVGLQIAAAIVLLIGTGLLLQTMVRYFQVDLGLNPDKLIITNLSIPSYKLARGDERAAGTAWDELLGSVRSLPSIESAAVSLMIPLRAGGMSTDFRLEGQPKEKMRDQFAFQDTATPNYFSTLSIPIREGRGFTEGDRQGAPVVAIVNESFRQTYFRGVSALGKQVWINDEWKTIIGVCGNVPNDGLQRETRPTIYFPLLQYPRNWAFLTVRTDLNTEQVRNLIRSRASEIRTDIRVGQPQTLDEVFQGMFSSARWHAFLVSAFGTVALILSAVGIFSVMAYSVSQRVREIGIRMACGAKPGEIVTMILGEAALVALAGISAGILAGLYLSQFIQHLLFQVEPINPIAFGASAALLLLTCVLASSLPAYRAAKIDPASALRHE